MRIRSLLIALLAMVACLSSGNICHAGFTFLGPTPYLSAADSPFPVDGSNPNFHLEDFEADISCVPGEYVLCGGTFDSHGARMTHGNTGQFMSVDADDGMIDGSGAAGFSALASAFMFIGSSTLVKFEVEFDMDELGFLPTAVGMVLTNGAGPGSGLRVYDTAGNEASFLTWDIELDLLTTSDDRFIGVVNPNGISKIVYGKRIFGSDRAIPRIDHFQYGLLVPEPTVKHIIAVLVIAILPFRFQIPY